MSLVMPALFGSVRSDSEGIREARLMVRKLEERGHLDHFLEEYFWRPTSIVSCSPGRFGGVRAAVTLRTVLGAVDRQGGEPPPVGV